jgi:uncharacterized protein (TIGR03435 family)
MIRGEAKTMIRNTCIVWLTIPGTALAPVALAQSKVTPQAAQASGKSVASSKRIAFDVVSIRPSKRGFFGPSPERETFEPRPDGYRAEDQPLVSTIDLAYFPGSHQWPPEPGPLNLPGWVGDEYDIQAKVAPADLADWQKQGPQKEMLGAMLRTMLEDRCKLVVHWVPGQTSGFALVVGKRGPMLKKATPGEPVPPNGLHVRVGSVFIPDATYFPWRKGDGRTDLPFYNISLEVLAEWLSGEMEMPILDKTGLAGNYDVVLHKRQKEDQSESDPGPSIEWDFEANGLKLVPLKVPTRRLVIDHLERPSPN